MHLINRDDFADVLMHEIKFRAANPPEDGEYENGLEVALDYVYNFPEADLTTMQLVDALRERDGVSYFEGPVSGDIMLIVRSEETNHDA